MPDEAAVRDGARRASVQPTEPAVKTEQAKTVAPMDLGDVSRLHQALGRSSRLLRESASGGLTPTQLAVLGALLRDGPRQITELAAAERINPTLLSRVVGRLDEGGLVRRSALQQDRRAYVVSITDAGAALVRELRSDRCAELAAVLDAMDPAHVAALVTALPALETLADELMSHRKD